MTQRKTKDLVHRLAQDVETTDLILAQEVQYKDGKQVRVGKTVIFSGSLDIIDAKNAGRDLGYSRMQILRWIEEGKLRAYKVNHTRNKMFRQGSLIFKTADLLKFFIETLAPGLAKMVAQNMEEYQALFRSHIQKPTKEKRRGQKRKPNGS